MKRLFVLAAVFFLSLSGFAQAAGPIVWEGRVYVTAVTSQCGFNSFVGDNFTSVFRPKLVSTDAAEGLTIVYPRAASVLISTAANGMLVNAAATLTNFRGTLVGIYASPITWNSTATLVKQPTTITASTLAVTISGTINNFNVAGCTLTVRGAYIRRP